MRDVFRRAMKFPSIAFGCICLFQSAAAQANETTLETEVTNLSREVAALSSVIAALAGEIESLKRGNEGGASSLPTGAAERRLYNQKDLAALGYPSRCNLAGSENCKALSERICVELGHQRVVKANMQDVYLPDSERNEGAVVLGILCE